MGKYGINMTSMKKKNINTILKTLKKNGPMSRKDIAKVIGLTPAAVTILVSELIEEGLIKELGLVEEEKRVGRKKILVDINYKFKYVVGINIERDLTFVGIGNLKGDILTSDTIKTDNKKDPKIFLNDVIDKSINLLWDLNIAKEDIACIGVGIIGKVDTNGNSIHAYGIWDEKVNIKEVIEEKLDIPVIVNNNVRALALAQLNIHNYDDMLFIKYGPGIGSSLVLNKQLYYGSNCSAGEIGHMIIHVDGPLCKCGKKGCLEALISSENTKEKIIKEYSKESTPVLFEVTNGVIEKINKTAIMESLEKEDMGVLKVYKDNAKYMAFGIYNSLTIYDTKKVVLYGDVFNIEPYMDLLKKELYDLLGQQYEDQLVISELIGFENCIGGVVLAMDYFFQ